jgi:L-amino acid N-acyltransferase YncA
MPPLLDAMVEARLSWTSADIAGWYGESDVRRQLRSGLADEADRVDNAAFGREFRDAVGLDLVDPIDWANRRIELSDGGWAVTGIRFRGRDVRLPFVDVVATTAPPTADGLAVVAAAVEPAYRAFRPRCLRVDVPDAAGLVARLAGDPRFGRRCDVDLHVLAGPVTDLRARSRAPSYPVVSLRAGDPDALAERVEAIYAELAERDARHAMWATAEDAESLAECSAEGLLFEVLADDTPAGVVAARREDGHAMAGFVVQELCLDASHRGRRLAPAVVQRLIDELPARAGDVLWGTVHPANKPSLRNARSVGRAVVGGYAWVAPAGAPGMPTRTVA